MSKTAIYLIVAVMLAPPLLWGLAGLAEAG